MDSKPVKRHMLPVWFFVGVILLIYGVLIMVTGLVEYSSGPETVLGNLHPAVWWGAIMAVAGAFYVNRYRPR